MEHKPIYLDGVDVSECNFAILPKDSCPAKSRPYAREISCIACKEHNTILNYCKNNPNCYFKQLSRKTQECEERYRKALEEIESYFEQPCEDCYASSKCRKCIEIEIIDIINKAKDGKNEQF